MTNGAAGSGERRPKAGLIGARRLHRLLVPALLVLTAALAISSLLGDSITYDETSHLTAGMSYLKTGDFRLAPDHPPLGKMWAAWPLLLVNQTWPPPETHGWQIADVFLTGRTWLFELNDGERLIIIPRCMMVLLLVGLCAAIYAAGRMLFGAAAGLLALVLAALSPTLLAHGRLVTTDVPITLCTTLTLLTFALLLRRVTWGRVLATAVALGAASVSKLSWPLVLPALAVMATVTVLRREPEGLAGTRAKRGKGAPRRRRERAAVVVALMLFLAATTWASIWSAYGWRASIFPAQAGAEPDPSVDRAAEELGAAWSRALYTADGERRSGLLPAFLRWASARHLLPDAYLFGLAWTLESTSGREAYFWGETDTGGWPLYFPTAFMIKTPIAVMALLAAGLAAVRWRRSGGCRDPVLLAGMVTYVVIHVAYVMNSSFNVGHRHLLPIYPVVIVLAGASAAWLETRTGRWLVGAAVVWLAAANLWIHPHYLSYFNELIGGPRRGHLYLADSNIDWGQDLKRLARYAERHPGETIKLSYFGSAVPTRYGFACELLPSSIETGSAEHLDGGGLYVISVTHLLGVYEPRAQDWFWEEPQVRAHYRELGAALQATTQVEGRATEGVRRRVREQYARLRWGRFLFNLRRRPPDERVGYSLFVCRLSAAEVEALTQP